MIDTIAQYPILAALIALVGLGILIGGLLGFAAEKFKVEGDPIVEQIDELLPQTQCGQCGFPGCKPYAESIANGDARAQCSLVASLTWCLVLVLRFLECNRCTRWLHLVIVWIDW